MNLLQDGDILVTDMTDPDWEPIMKKASAIVTNRGGRTCHAAIIARGWEFLLLLVQVIQQKFFLIRKQCQFLALRVTRLRL